MLLWFVTLITFMKASITYTSVCSITQPNTWYSQLVNAGQKVKIMIDVALAILD